MSTAVKRESPPWTCRLGTYALVSSAVIPFAPAADAAIIYHSADLLISQIGPGQKSVDLDLNSDGATDYSATVMAASYCVVGPCAEVGLDGGQIVGLDTGSNVVALAIEPGLSIGPTLPYDSPNRSWEDGWLPLYAAKYGGFATWPDDLNNPAYAGLRFQISGQTHYAWMRVGTYANNANLAAQMRIYDWAYESRPDTAIPAGAMPSPDNPVPEPSTLALFALGAAGIALLKRRRGPMPD